MLYDLAIIGGGPAAVAAGVYASRKRIKTIFITKDFGGQSVVSDDIQNWVGTVSLSGAQLADNLKKHLEAYAEDVVDIKVGELAEKVEKLNNNFVVKTDKGKYEAKTILITTGSSRRKLNAPGAAEFENKGITYCASCDGPMFSGQDVAVIGGGNAGFETASQLLAYCPSVTLLELMDKFRADPVTVEKVLKNQKMKALASVKILEIKGDKFVKAIIYQETNGKKVELPVGGIFVEIGMISATNLVNGLVELDNGGRIVADPRTQRASLSGIWAAGDCADGLYQQNNIAAGDAVKALEDIYLFLNAK
ncbi:MAG: Alkyl hydroperoxide reductase [Parcubacteria group bacterium Gr01-1014_73]|nr:MAG: Alkyl hydroperoxide reductase [Parcubacteria group bacterium Gr01-1014_73]